jgi:hypothetical protein
MVYCSLGSKLTPIPNLVRRRARGSGPANLKCVQFRELNQSGVNDLGGLDCASY